MVGIVNITTSEPIQFGMVIDDDQGDKFEVTTSGFKDFPSDTEPDRGNVSIIKTCALFKLVNKTNSGCPPPSTLCTQL